MKQWLLIRYVAICVIVCEAHALLGQQALVVPADKAMLIVRVPASDATLNIGGYESPQRGLERLFYTPSLQAGSYSYVIEAAWNGKKQTRQVVMETGKVNIVDFNVEVGEKIGLPAVSSKSKTRSFLFTYAGAVKELPPGKEASVWLPFAVSGPEQEVIVLAKNLPGGATQHTEKQYGNPMFHFVGKANKEGQIPFEVVYEVRRKEVKTDLAANLVLKPAAKENISRFLEPDAKVPIVGKPLELLKDRKIPGDPFAAAKVFYDVVNNHMKYSKEGKGWGQGDAVWACDSKFGNCSDFHSLFISMARGNKIPSKFEMGFPLPAKHGKGAIGGYHCWAWFYPQGKGWVPVDISEANRNPDLKEYYFGNLTEDRVRFTTGRDINLEPRQKGPPLNFFIYPYAEVDGQPYDKIDRRFAYEDVK